MSKYYHTTEYKKLSSIKENGLRAESPSDNNWRIDQAPKGVYAWKNFSHAEMWMLEVECESNTTAIIVEIETEKIPEDDWDLPGAVMFTESIAPEEIKAYYVRQV